MLFATLERQSIPVSLSLFVPPLARKQKLKIIFLKIALTCESNVIKITLTQAIINYHVLDSSGDS